MYNEAVLDHFANPRNSGKLTDPDAMGESGSKADGDKIILYLKIMDNRIQEIKFQTFGCAAAIAASSMLTVLSMGKTLEEARMISNADVSEALGGLPPHKINCSNIAADALHDALDHYTGQQKTCAMPNPSNYGQDQEEEDKLDANQAQRYLRQIILPEIRSAGQRKLIHSHIVIIIPSIRIGELLIAYLSAAGAGRISCLIENDAGEHEFLSHVRGLNPEVEINISEISNVKGAEIKQADAVYVAGSGAFITYYSKLYRQFFLSVIQSGKPVLTAEIHEWHGCLRILNSEVLGPQGRDGDDGNVKVERYASHEYEEFSLGVMFSAAFAGVLAVTEITKFILNAGKALTEPFWYNLLSMDFTGHLEMTAKWPPKDELRLRLSGAKVLIAGSGGLGSPSAYMLARSGIGTIGLIDDDRVELSNLNRQILHRTDKIGEPKVQSAAATLQTLNPDLVVKTCQERLTHWNAARLLRDYDLMIDGLDNLPTRYAANSAAVNAGKPFIQAGVLSFYGQSTTVVPSGPCYECIFPQSEMAENLQSCAETGVFGAVPGLMGVIQAAEAVKILSGAEPSLNGKILMVDVLETDFSIIEIGNRRNCHCCGIRTHEHNQQSIE